jgi:hypothetical protein
MPLHGIDHVELYVGNARQSAHFYVHALGFKEVAYAGLHTGIRDRTSHVLEQGRIRLVLTGALTPGIRAIRLEADRMGTLLDALSQENLDNQREVVKNEKRWSYDNRPYGSWQEKLQAHLFPPEHPYHHSTIGSMEDLDAASIEDVSAFDGGTEALGVVGVHHLEYVAPNRVPLFSEKPFDVVAVHRRSAVAAPVIAQRCRSTNRSEPGGPPEPLQPSPPSEAGIRGRAPRALGHGPRRYFVRRAHSGRSGDGS